MQRGFSDHSAFAHRRKATEKHLRKPTGSHTTRTQKESHRARVVLLGWHYDMQCNAIFGQHEPPAATSGAFTQRSRCWRSSAAGMPQFHLVRFPRGYPCTPAVVRGSCRGAHTTSSHRVSPSREPDLSLERSVAGISPGVVGVATRSVDAKRRSRPSLPTRSRAFRPKAPKVYRSKAKESPFHSSLHSYGYTVLCLTAAQRRSNYWDTARVVLVLV